VTPQLGVAGFRIDLAVKHPDYPDAYLAGIECDGATYHSAQSVRDRDRIRQEILESMGWRGRIWRIWSTDWFRTPTKEAEKLLSFLAELRASWKPEYPSGASWIEEERGSRRARPITVPVLEDDELCVRVGDTVCYMDINKPGDVLVVQIVEGANDLAAGAIHKGKPLAQALLGAVEGDEVTMHLPGSAARNFKIVSIKRESSARND
jgi:hypothetical protein